MGFIYVLEFGGQYTDLIVNRLEEMGFPAKHVDSNARISELPDANGIIASGGPKSVKNPDRYPFDPVLYSAGIPYLGICYGLQLLGDQCGAHIHHDTREYGETVFIPVSKDPLLDGLREMEIVWMSHGDSITGSDKLDILGYTEKGVIGAIRSKLGPYRGVQFHPEVFHTENGKLILRNFAEKICGIEPTVKQSEEFDADGYIESAIRKLRSEIGNNDAFVYTSGGVDSTVAAVLAREAGIKFKPIYLEMGNGRKDEAKYVSEIIGKILGREIYVHNREEYFLNSLRGLDDPEVKRKAFAKLYAATKKEIEDEFSTMGAYLIQGTIATDRRETAKEAGKGKYIDRGTVDRIKTHHNVGAEDLLGIRCVAPLEELTKDRVRIVARKLGISNSERQPYPGPGLIIRYITAVHEVPEYLEMQVNEIANKYGLKGTVLPVKGVGLKGDERAYEWLAYLQGESDWKNIRRASKKMIEDLEICRVVYSFRDDVSINPRDFLDIKFLTKTGLDGLREVTQIVESTMDGYGVKSDQTPVIKIPGKKNLYMIRDVNSRDFRTCRPLKKSEEFPIECIREIEHMIQSSESLQKFEKPGYVVYDVSDKPGGTTEME